MFLFSRWSQRTIAAGLLALVSLGGCREAPRPSNSGGSSYPGYGGYGDGPITVNFLDDVASQSPPEVPLSRLTITQADGTETSLEELAADKPLVVVVTRGFNGAICPYCSTQTARLIHNYAEIQKRHAEVIVVYPVEQPSDRERLDEFLAKVRTIDAPISEPKPPFPIVLDIGLKLVDALGIRRDLSKPATYVLDRQRSIRFAYVGSSLADRPSVKAILAQLDGLSGSPATDTNPAGETPTNQSRTNPSPANQSRAE